MRPSPRLEESYSDTVDGLCNRTSFRVCRRHYPEFLVAALVDPEIKHSASVAFHICWPLTERLHVWIRFENYPSVLRITRKQRQSPSKFGAEDLYTPLPRPPFDFTT
jgi:hypothetical protein